MNVVFYEGNIISHTMHFDGRFKVTFDDNDGNFYTASQLCLFPEQYSPYEGQ